MFLRILQYSQPLCWGLWRSATLLKRDSNTGVFLRILQNFYKRLFYRTPWWLVLKVTVQNREISSWTVLLFSEPTIFPNNHFWNHTLVFVNVNFVILVAAFEYVSSFWSLIWSNHVWASCLTAFRPLKEIKTIQIIY